MSPSPVPENKQLYTKVKAEADKLFLAPTSAYKSGWIVKTYKDRGGTYAVSSSGPPSKKTGLRRWFAEKWVNIMGPTDDAPCGRARATTKGVYPVCRPKIRITKDTPLTIGELTPSRIKDAVDKKQKVKQMKHIKF
jgi:hypothetical protein